MNIGEKDIFHVHTYRCGHAENVSDEEYVKKALLCGTSGIWFTDHAPFPGDPFGNRMKYSELDEYIETLFGLKQKYKELKSKENLEMMLLGQHMAEIDSGKYTFSWDKDKLDEEEYVALGNAQLQGIRSGYFDVVAHPDRIFRRQKAWSEDMDIMAEKIVESACHMNIPLEMNESSMKQKNHFWKEFWEKVNTAYVVHGLDAHSLNEMK